MTGASTSAFRSLTYFYCASRIPLQAIVGGELLCGWGSGNRDSVPPRVAFKLGFDILACAVAHAASCFPMVSHKLAGLILKLGDRSHVGLRFSP